MTDTLVVSPTADIGRLRYAEACLKQGMAYQAASVAAGVNEADLRAFAPDHAAPHREVPSAGRTAFARCAVVLPDAYPEELARIASLALKLLHDSAGSIVVRDVCANIIRKLPGGVSPRDRLLDIVSTVAAKHDVSLSEVMGRSRLQRFIFARQDAYWALRHEAGLSFPQIGRFFGRDHTTIIYGISAHEKRMAAQ